MNRLTLFLFLLLCVLCRGCRAVYLTNTSSVKKNQDNPAVWTEDEGVWGPLLEEWTIGNRRNGRVMMIPLMQNSYIAEDKIDDNVNEKKGKISPGKVIVNDNRKPQPSRQVSETDLYLLGAIEKLVYRVDFMEKRLRRAEEMLYYAVAGNRIDTEPCPNNFTRIGPKCYYFHSNAGRENDWKAASKHCKKLAGFLAEMESIEENQDIIAYIQTDKHLKGKDFLDGGLEPRAALDLE
ncbi:hypothetical protein NQ317_017691 [Molorchus minor]|uniref:C-type lectin domain-containing protein n=1 Tax=Molorchus minor TaxID=1323400 RepID=A0ABQ9JNG8_9CUCU|nr:hypothetical protein NQ317_017691 [Molorchus minor]